MADIDVSIFDSVSALDLYYGEMHREVPARYDLVGTGEYVVVDTFIPLEIFESVSVSEYYESWGGGFTKSEAIAVSDVPTISFAYFMAEDPRADYKMKMPVWELNASFNLAFSISESLWQPARLGLAYFGGRLSEKIPVHSISASMSVLSIGSSLDRNIPVWSGSGSFGARLNSRIPVGTLSASFAFADSFRLAAKLPIWRLDAAFTYPNSFTLSRQIPAWIGGGELLLAVVSGAYLDEKIPGALIFRGSMHEEGVFSLDEKIPVWRLESSMYSPVFYLSGNIPVWIIENVFDGYLKEENRFSDYILRYIRP
jgi:hypothetical protein